MDYDYLYMIKLKWTMLETKARENLVFIHFVMNL